MSIDFFAIIIFTLLYFIVTALLHIKRDRIIRRELLKQLRKDFGKY